LELSIVDFLLSIAAFNEVCLSIIGEMLQKWNEKGREKSLRDAVKSCGARRKDFCVFEKAGCGGVAENERSGF
jgi:hypothetical protein